MATRNSEIKARFTSRVQLVMLVAIVAVLCVNFG